MTEKLEARYVSFHYLRAKIIALANAKNQEGAAVVHVVCSHTNLSAASLYTRNVNVSAPAQIVNKMPATPPSP